MSAQAVGRRDGAALEGGLGPPRHRVRRLHPNHRGPPHGRGSAAPQRRPRQRPRRHLPRDLRGALLRVVRGLLHRGGAHRRALPDPRAAGRADGRGELLLPPLRLRGPPPRALRGAPRGGRARDPPERSRCPRSAVASRTSRSAGRRSTGASRCPGIRQHVCYVWFDALTNYITAAGYADAPERFARMWPANIHSIGKDILRFHAIYWPAMLMAGNVEPPNQVWAHGFLTVGGKKMSKTNATGIHPFELLDVFGVDSYRYYFMREIQFGQDGSFSYEAMVERHNADLANGLGNLASRVLAMLASSFDGTVPAFTTEGAESDLPAVTAEAAARYQAHMQNVELSPALAATWEIVARANHYLVEKEPWKIKDEASRDELAQHPLRLRRNPPHPRGPHLPHHAESRERPLVATRNRRGDRGTTSPRCRGVGRPGGRNENHERRKPLPQVGDRVRSSGGRVVPSGPTLRSGAAKRRAPEAEARRDDPDRPPDLLLAPLRGESSQASCFT